MAIRYSQSIEPLPESGLHRFFKSHAAKISLEVGNELSFEGNEPCVSYVTEGWIQRLHSSDCGRQAVTGTYVPGDIINLDTLCEEEPLGRLFALTAAEVLALPVSKLRESFDTDPTLALDVIQRIIAEGDWLREAVMAISQLRSREKIIYFFGQMRRRQIAFGTLNPTMKQFPMPITQAQLAIVVGISSIHVSRLLKELREMKILTLRGRRISVFDVVAFDRMFADLNNFN